MGRPWQQSFGVLKDWYYAAKRRRAHTIVRKQEPMLVCLTYDALLSLEFDYSVLRKYLNDNPKS
jgi:hypothetical protein